MINNGYSNRETMYVSDLLGADYGEVLLDMGYSFEDEEHLARHLSEDIHGRVDAVVEDGSDVKDLVRSMLAHVEWDELAAEIAYHYSNVLEVGA